jgi:hypothetical protein
MGFRDGPRGVRLGAWEDWNSIPDGRRSGRRDMEGGGIVKVGRGGVKGYSVLLGRLAWLIAIAIPSPTT